MRSQPILQSLWIGTSLTRMERLSIRSFLQKSYGFHLYVYGEVSGVPEGVTLKDANAIVPQDQIFKYREYDSYAGFANLFRYKLLLENGGYWTDLDIVCLQPFTMAGEYVFASERLPQKVVQVRGGRLIGLPSTMPEHFIFTNPTLPQQVIQVNNCLMRVPKHSDIMEFCYSTASKKQPSELNWGDMGPKLLTEAVIRFNLEEYVVDPDVICPVNWWDGIKLISQPLQDVVTKDTCAIHLWNEIWRRNNADKSISYDKNCMYEELNAIYAVD